MESATLKTRYAKDCKCTACGGSGKRRKGKCSACDGKGKADLDHPRIKFNWGYHDARHERTLGIARTPSFEFSFWYALGHEAGRGDTDESKKSSAGAWTAKTSGLPESF